MLLIMPGRVRSFIHHSSSRATALASDIEPTELIILNDGHPAYFGHLGARSILDLTLASPDLDVCWSLDFDTRGVTIRQYVFICPRLAHFRVAPT